MNTIKAETSKARGRIRIETGSKRVRAYLGGEVVADTTAPVLVWEVTYYPTYHCPVRDVRAELVADGAVVHSPSRGDGRALSVKAGGRRRRAPRCATRARRCRSCAS